MCSLYFISSIASWQSLAARLAVGVGAVLMASRQVPRRASRRCVGGSSVVVVCLAWFSAVVAVGSRIATFPSLRRGGYISRAFFLYGRSAGC